MNVKINVHEGNRNLNVALKRLEDWKVPSELKRDIKEFIKQLGSGQVNFGRKVNERTQVKYIDLLKTPLTYISMNTKEITLKDIEVFEKELTSGKIFSMKGKPYTHSTQSNIKLSLKVFLKWSLGEEKSRKLAGWLDTRDKKKTPDYLKESEVEKLYKNCKSAKERYLIAVLFDSGSRAEEFLNIRYEDVELPSREKNFVKLTLKEEYSKTKGRVISLYWKNSLDAVSDYIKEREIEGIKSQDVVFNSSYDAIRMFLNRLGKKVLTKDINPHLFRHSSATHYACKFNRQELCYRYGWAFSSDMPDVYISRAGMNSKDLDEKLEHTELGELKAKLSKEEFERKKLQEDNKQIKEMLSKIIDKVKTLGVIEGVS